MYENLIGMIAVQKIPKTTIASAMGIDRTTFENKLRGISKFSISEMFFIKEKFFPNTKEEYLFAKSTGISE